MTTTHKTDDDDRAAEVKARRAKVRAERAAAGVAPSGFETMTVRVGDLQVGDYVDVIPTQANVRGFRAGCALLTPPELDMNYWAFGPARRRYPVAAYRLHLGGVVTVVPAEFSVDIRRPVSL